MNPQPCPTCGRPAYLFLRGHCTRCVPEAPKPAAIDFESVKPLVCDPNRPDAETCESCQ